MLCVRMVGGPLHNSYTCHEGDVFPAAWIHAAPDPELAACDFLPGEHDFIIMSRQAYVEIRYFLRSMRSEYGTRFWEYHWEEWEEPTSVAWGNFDAEIR